MESFFAFYLRNSSKIALVLVTIIGLGLLLQFGTLFSLYDLVGESNECATEICKNEIESELNGSEFIAITGRILMAASAVVLAVLSLIVSPIAKKRLSKSIDAKRDDGSSS